MSGNVSGGDAGALVIDCGSYSVRAGYAGEHSPKADVPTKAGMIEEFFLDAMNLNASGASNGELVKRQYFIDTKSIHKPRQDVQMYSFLKDGMMEDWEMFESVLEYIYSEHIKSESHLHPVLMSEASWNVRSKREKLTEIMFEKFNIPSFFLSKNAVLAAYANGRTTGIVVDSGFSQTSAVPVQDGFVLSKAIVRSALAGDFMSMLSKRFLDENKIELIPTYLIASKEVVKENTPPKWIKKSNLPKVTRSWHNFMLKELIQDFQHSILQVHETPADQEVLNNLPMVHYEFPNGYNQDFSAKRFLIAEALFDPTIIRNAPAFAFGVPRLVTTSIGMCDAGVRSSLYGGVIVTGGNTLIQGFNERLDRDLSAKIPSNMRLEIISPQERRFGAWFGGSCFATTLTLQGMWITKQEYDEEGKTQVQKKCP